MTRNIQNILLIILIVVPLQVLVFRNFVFFNVGYSFIYLLLLLMLPLEVSIGLGMVVALISGLIVDVFFQSIGIHAASAVLIMFIKPFWQRLSNPRSGYEANDLMLIHNYGLGWFLGYAGPLIFIYCLSVMMIEAASWSLFWLALLRAFVSTIFTLFFIVSAQLLIFSKGK